jgi:hypothetical protein
MNRRSLLWAAAVPLLGACMRERAFELAWDEEVQLADGPVILLHLRHAYERLGGDTALLRDTTLTFDAGGRTVTQLFKGFHPMFLDRDQGTWFGVLYGSYYDRTREMPGQDWGELEGPHGQWAIRLTPDGWKPMSMTRLPARFEQPNLLMLYGTPQEHAQFHGKRVTLADKAAWLRKYPLSYADVRLARPIVPSKRPDATTN